MRDFKVSFIGRESEFEEAYSYLTDESLIDGRLLLVQGDSGTGKTFFVRKVIHQLHQEIPASLFLYLDVPSDEYVSSRSLESLLSMVVVPGTMTGSSSISIPKNLTFEKYRKSSRKLGVGLGFFRAIIHAVGIAFGVGAIAEVAFSNSGTTNADVDNELAKYLAWAAKKQSIFLVIDNIQHLKLDDRLRLESVMQRAGGKLRLVVIDRTKDGKSLLDPPLRCFAENQSFLEIKKLTQAETMLLVANTVEGLYSHEVKQLAHDIYTKTNGLAKDIEYCLRQYSLEVGSGSEVEAIEGLLSTVDRLPVIHRQFLVISALLDGGVKKKIARQAVARLTQQDDTQLNAIIDELIASDYLRFENGIKNHLRPGHERIVTAVRDLADDELQEEVKQALASEIVQTLKTSIDPETETYLLHCFIGLQSAKELLKNLNYVSKLIQSQYRQDQFSYLVSLTDEIYDILPLLPVHVLNDLLDAMQKSSTFEKGLQILRLLDAEEVPSSPKRELFRIQYLTQAYQYDEALELFKKIDDSEWASVHHVTLLIMLDRLDEALEVAEVQLKTQWPDITEAQAIQRRNTITLFKPETALEHLDEATQYFKRNYSEFRLATIDTNRSLVYMDTGQLDKAGECLQRSMKVMQSIGSREIYQAQINEAIRLAILQRYDDAIAMLDDAELHFPHSLLNDRIKINVNRLVIQRVAGLIDNETCLQGFTQCSKQTQGLHLPLAHKILAINITAAEGKPLASWNSTGKVQYAVELNEMDTTWYLAKSFHWRY